MMAVSTRSRPHRDPDSSSSGNADLLVCETCPGRSVFVEAGNAQGWIATDLTVDLDR
jgi:hypothetical protein